MERDDGVVDDNNNNKNEEILLECDYDRNPTQLFMLIQHKEWDGVKHQAHVFDEAKTWIVRRSSNIGLVKWRLLPLHFAILEDCPTDVIQALLEAYAQAAEFQDDHGMLPIHLAIRKHRDAESMNALLVANPKCLDVKNYDGKTPFEMAMKSSSPHRSYYLKVLRRGPTYDAVTGSMSDLLCGISLETLTNPKACLMECGAIMDPQVCLSDLGDMDPRKCLSATE